MYFLHSLAVDLPPFPSKLSLSELTKSSNKHLVASSHIKILFPGPLIQPVNSSETKIKRPTYYRCCKAILGFTVLVLVFLFFVFFYFHISHNAPYLPPTPITMLLQNFFLWAGRGGGGQIRCIMGSPRESQSLLSLRWSWERLWDGML